MQLNSEAAQNALDLQEIMDILDNPPALTLECPQTDLIQNNITCNDSLSNASTDLSTSVIPSVTLSSDNFPTDNCDYKLIKSSKGHDKLSHEGFIYNFQREDSVKKQWRCQVKNCRGRIHTKSTNIPKMIGEHCHGPEIGAEEVLVFRAGIKRRAQESHDNPHRIVAEISGSMSEIAKTLLPPEKSLKRTCQRARPARANPTSLLDLVIDQNIKTLGGKEFLIYDSGPGSDRILMFGTEENKHILTISSIWMADGTFKTIPSLFAQLYTIHGLAGGVYPFLDGHLLPCIYVLLPGKSSFYYRKMWKIIKDLCPNSNPQYLLVDFEKAAINTFREIWALTYIKGCFSIYLRLSIQRYRKLGCKLAI